MAEQGDGDSGGGLREKKIQSSAQSGAVSWFTLLTPTRKGHSFVFLYFSVNNKTENETRSSFCKPDDYNNSLQESLRLKFRRSDALRL